MNVKRFLSTKLDAAFAAAGAPDRAAVAPAARPEFGDYQANGAMAAAKRLGVEPRELAARVIEAAELDGVAEALDVAGPGFINIHLRTDFLAGLLTGDMPLLTRADSPEDVVVDYSSPNLAKEMHVGHLRGTIIGDAVVRVLEALGHRVIRQNHVGDWGTQFGMLIAHLEETGADSQELADLEVFYGEAKRHFDDDPDFARRARARVVALQSGDPAVLERWRTFIEISLSHCESVYRRLGVTLTRADVMAESAYNDRLAATVAALDQAGVLTESDGAQCVFLPEFKGKDGEPLPFIVQKSDGGYLYATTDLAAIAHRRENLGVRRALYFVDARQSLHFEQLFAVARAAGLLGAGDRFEHMPFGVMLGADGRPFRTRAGGLVKLTALLDEAEARALALLDARDARIDPDHREAVARAVGIGALKYADLSRNRVSDYVFDWEQMLSFDGNTAPYLQYAYARIRSIFRRGDVDAGTVTAPPSLEAAEERRLGVTLARVQEVVEQVAEDGSPHHLTGYLYDVAQQFTRFYETCPVLDADEPRRSGRLALARRTAETLAGGLELLGIETIERM